MVHVSLGNNRQETDKLVKGVVRRRQKQECKKVKVVD